MKKNLQIILLILCTLFTSIHTVKSQGLTNADYKKALWMTARMYGGQRSGDGPNWLTMDHTPLTADLNNLTTNKGAIQSQLVKGKDFTKDADGTTSLSGGWVDCGDHVKFGQTYYYAAYTLLKGYAEFTAGYDDLYTANYSDYQAGVDFSYEGGKGKPNGIPDILDEVKYETDFFIKCTPNSSTFYSQVGDGGLDHQNWVTSPVMAILPKAQGGQNDGARFFVKNPADAAMPSMCAATLALMARVYAKFDPAYAATCLSHAVYAYNYAKAHPSTEAAPGGFYPKNAKWEDDFVNACSELYWATGTTSYKTEALTYVSGMKTHNYCYNYNNCDDVAAFNLAKLGDASMKTLLQSFVTTYIASVTGGIYNGGDNSWGSLRYPANAAFIVGLWGALNNSTTVDAFIYNQIDFILGKNSSNFSFVVGFKKAAGGTYAVHPHHRNVYLINDITANQNSMVIPAHNTQQGYLIGGKRTVPFTESAIDYTTSEGGVDYNAGLVGAIGYILSRIAPIDVNKFGHPSASLGPNQSMCGVTSVLLNSNVSADGKKTFTWKKDGTTVVTASTTANTYSATAAGVYICQIDSTGWSTTGTITITASLPDFSIGADNALCTQTSDTLNAPAGTGFSYAWKCNGTTISSATSNSYIVYKAGTYICSISANGCTAKSDTAIITSNLLAVIHDTICKAGVATLSVTSTGNFAWYNVATGGTVLASGSNYSPSISTSSIYYVQDASTLAGSAGPNPSTFSGGSNGTPDNQEELRFEAIGNYTITNLYIPYMLYGASEAAKIASFEIVDDASGAVVATQTGVTGSMNSGTYSAQGPYLIKFTVNLTVNGGVAGTPKILRLRFVSSATPSNSGNVYLYNDGSTPNAFPYPNTTNPPLKIIGSRFYNTNTTNRYACFVKIDYLAGSSCSRTPVLAIIDTNLPCGDTQSPTTPGPISFSSTTSTGFTATWAASTDNTAVTGYEVFVNGTLNSTVTTTNITLTGLTCNTAYTIKVRAKDAAGNYSAYTADAINTTTGTALPTVMTPVTYCQNATATAITATGTALKWYTVSTAGTALASAPTPSTSVTGTTTYYVSQTLTSCESARASIAVTVNAFPSAPTVVSPVNYVLNATATALTATGTALKWYSVLTGGTELTSTPTPTTTAIGTKNYYVSQTINTCESPRATIAVVVTSNIAPSVSISAPANNATYTAPATITLTATATDADGTIANVKFYNGTTLLGTVTTSPYTYLWSSVAAGTYTITAVATDNAGSSTTATAITLIVNATQTITLNAGWNIISFNVQPSNMAVSSVFNSLGTNLVTVKNADGFYDPAQATFQNSLTNIENGKAYLVKIKTATSITVTGNIVGTTILTLKSGWNLVGYPKQTSGTITTVLSGIWTTYTQMKDFNGFHIKNGTLNSLTNMIPNSGYFIKVTADCTLTY